MWIANLAKDHIPFLENLLKKSLKSNMPKDFNIKGVIGLNETIINNDNRTISLRIKRNCWDREENFGFYENGEMVFFIDYNCNYAALNEKYFEEGMRIILLRSEKFYLSFKCNKDDLDLLLNIKNTGICKSVNSETGEIILNKTRFIPDNDRKIKDFIDQTIYSVDNDFVSINEFIMCTFEHIKNCFSKFYEYKEYIVNGLIRRNLARLSMFEPNIPVCFIQEIRISNKAKESGAIKSFVSELKKQGFINKSNLIENEKSDLKTYQKSSKKYTVSDSENLICWSYFRFYDDKFNDGSFTYYRHVVRKHILENKEKHTERIIIFDKLNEKIDILQDGYRIIPYLTKQTFENAVKKLYVYQKYTEMCTDLGVTFNTISFNSYLMMRLLKRFNVEESVFILFKITSLNFNSDAHDIFFRCEQILGKPSTLLTKKALKIVLLKDENSLDFHLTQLSRLNNIVEHDKKELRKYLSSAIKKKQNIKTFIDEVIEKELNTFLKRKKIKNIDDYQSFINQMNIYNHEITIMDLFSTFKANSKKIVLGKIEGIFEHEIIYPDQTTLGETIKNILSSKDRKAKKIYTKLNSLHPVKEMIEGNIPHELVNEILKVLKEHRVEVKFSSVSNFHGMIEQKCSPEFLIAGDASKCCMNFGTEKAIDYALEKGFGVFNIYYKNKIIANSVLWINEEHNMLIVDNVEVNPNYKRYQDHIINLYQVMMKNVVKKYGLFGAIQGISYNDLKLYNVENQLANEKISNLSFSIKGVSKKDVYLDAEEGIIIYDPFNLKESILKKCNNPRKVFLNDNVIDNESLQDYASAC